MQGNLPEGVICATDLALGSIQPNPFRLRRRPAQAHIEALADSIRQVGLIEPICARPLADGLYQIIAGECRWRAAKLVGLERVPCRIYDVTEAQAFVIALAENLQRHDLSPVEEATSYQQMLDRGIARNRAAIARLLGVTRARITQRMKLLELDRVTQQIMLDHRDILTERHGRVLWEITDVSVRRALAEEAVARRWSASRLEGVVNQHKRAGEVAEWQQQGAAGPRAYTITYMGFHLSVDFRQANRHHVVETLRRLAERWDAIGYSVQAPASLTDVTVPPRWGSVKSV